MRKILVGLIGLAAATTLTVPATAAQAAPAPGPVPAWMTYARPAEYTAVVTQNIKIPVRTDGWLSCDLYQPGTNGIPATPAAGRFPAVFYQYHGYGENRAVSDPPQLESLAQRGYVGLQCNTPGTGGSPGRFDLFSDIEARDGYDAIEWLAKQRWSNGNVGMVGYSYGAVNAYRVAGLRPPHLRTIVPQSSWESLTRDIVHLGGASNTDVRVFMLGLVLSLNDAITPPAQLVALEQRCIEIDAEWQKHPANDAYWNKYDINVAAIRDSGIPILGFGGWYDIFQRGMPKMYQELKKQTYLVMNNVSHVDTGQTYYGRSDGPTLAWLDHWLQPARKAPLPSARVTAYQMPGATGGWTQLADWPPTSAESRVLSLDAGKLTSDPGAPGSTSYSVDAHDGMPTYWNIGDRPDSAPIVAWHTAKEAVRTHFTTAPLGRDLVVAGTPIAVVDAAFTATDGVLVARLSDVAPDGTTTLVSTGWLRAATAVDPSKIQPVTPGTMHPYRVEIWPTDWRFTAGHRLQLSISSGDVPRLFPDAPSGTVTIRTGADGSHLFLPIQP